MKDKISLQQLNLYYGNFHALKDITTSFPDNSVTALIGASGCGKSTLLRTLNRMAELDKNCKITGKVLLNGKNIYNETDATVLRKRVGMVFQKPNPFDMSIYDNIAFGPRTHGIKNREELNNIIEASLRGAYLWNEVKDTLKKNALTLSGGQQQRLCIARALAVDPEVLLMDEATSALDPVSAMRVENVIAKLKTRKAIILVTHSMTQAIRVSDKTVFLSSGTIIEAGRTADFFTNPKTKQAKEYLNTGW